MKAYQKLLIFFFLIHCQSPQTPEESIPQNTAPPVPLRETVLDSLRHPWSMAFLSEAEVLITEKDGNLLRANLESKEKTLIQGFPEDLVDSIRIKDGRDNSGIFEVLVDPDFAQNQYVYVAYAAENEAGNGTQVIRAVLKEDSLEQVKVLLSVQPFSPVLFHYGGGMCFGPDGKLYITAGEHFYQVIDQPELPVAQNVGDPRGMIYRLNPDGSIPEDNPDWGEGAVPGAYAIGIRAAQGLAVNPQTQRIWFSEHGTQQGDEVNLLQAGANYGWPIQTTGKYRAEDYTPPTLEGREYTAPAWYWEQTVAPTGLCFYTGPEFPEWQGNLIVPGLSAGSCWRLVVSGDTISEAIPLFAEEPLRLRKAVQSPGGALYLLSDEPQGRVLRVRRTQDFKED